MPLISIHVASNRPRRLREFVERLAATSSRTDSWELVVKVDSEDDASRRGAERLAEEWPGQIRPLVTAREGGYYDLWKSYNQLIPLSHPDAYFFWLVSDEVHFTTPGWDQHLEAYRGFFPDHVFRLRVKEHLRAYHDIFETCTLPDIAITTRRWLELSGNWSDTHSPDVIQQMISYYLDRFGSPRDVPCFDVEIGGVEAGLDIASAESTARSRLVILAHESGCAEPTLQDESEVCVIRVDPPLADRSSQAPIVVDYRLSRAGVVLANFWRIVNRPGFIGYHGYPLYQRLWFELFRWSLAVPRLLVGLALDTLVASAPNVLGRFRWGRRLLSRRRSFDRSPAVSLVALVLRPVPPLYRYGREVYRARKQAA
jgi:hypothetical protein